MENRHLKTPEQLVQKSPDISQQLPMEAYSEQALEVLKSNTSVIIGETGSGKTTHLPVLLRKAYPDARIICSQPRVPAASSVAKYVAEKAGVPLGSEVGYHTRFDDQTTAGTKLTFMTDGILLKILQKDKVLSECDIVMVDEAHERSLNIDFILGLLKRAQKEREVQGMKQLKVVVTSATIEKEKFVKYFEGSPSLEVPGRMFPVEVIYSNYDVDDYPKEAAQKVGEFLSTNKKGDILIFMPGQKEITKTIEEIEKVLEANFGGHDTYDVMPLLGSTTTEEQNRAIYPSKKRKIIVATNVAETSLTINGLGCVIDSGLINQVQFNPETGIEALVTVPHAKSGCDQRKGRAGRVGEGVCYRLYTEGQFKNRIPFQIPELTRSNLDHVILAMKKMGIEDIPHFDFMDKPGIEAINEAIRTLTILGALDEEGNLTKTGEVMAELPLRPETARMVLEAYKFKCVESVGTIASMLGGKPVFNRPKDFEDEADMAHSQFKNLDSDFLTLLNVWNKWVESGYSAAWARANFLNGRRLFEMKEARSQLFKELAKHHIAAVDKTENPEEGIQKSIIAGNLHRLMKNNGSKGYNTMDDFIKKSNSPMLSRIIDGEKTQEYFIHPSSSLFSMLPEFIIGSDVMETKKVYARRCQKVISEWLVECAPHLFNKVAGTMEYDFIKKGMVESSRYSFKNAPKLFISAKEDIKDKEKATRELAKLLVGGHYASIHTEFSSLNRRTMEKIKELHERTGGKVNVPDFVKWFESKLDGRYTLEESDNENLLLNMNDFIPEDRLREIEKKYPTVILVHGEVVHIVYHYNDMYTEGNTYTATLIFPDGLLDITKEEDIPKLGEEDNSPKILYKGHDGNSFRDYETLSELKNERARARKAISDRTYPSTGYNSSYRSSAYDSAYTPLGTKNPPNTSLGDLLKAKLNNGGTTTQNQTVPEKEHVAKQPTQVLEKEVMTDELRTSFIHSLDIARFFIQYVKSYKIASSVVNKDKIAKITKLITNAEETLKELRTYKRDLETADNVERARGKVLEFSKKGERLVDTLANLLGIDSWIEKYKTLTKRFEEIATEQKIPLTEEVKLQIRDKIRDLAQSGVTNTDEELENILIEVA